MFDNNLQFRTGTTSLTSTETSSAIVINETPISGLCLSVHIPKQAANTLLQVTLRHSTDDSTYTDLVKLDTIAASTVAVTTPQTLRQRFYTRAKFLKTVATTSGTGSPDFGGVVINIGDADAANNYTVTAATKPQGT